MKSIGRVLGISLAVVASFSVSLHAAEILGAGATFPYPLYSKMFDEYNKATGNKVNYQSIGSGGGIRQLGSKTVDFGASDDFLSDEELKAQPAPMVHIPIVSGAVVLSFNIEGVKKLNLTPDIIADIFLGKIQKWDDKRIVAINKSVKLPGIDIVNIRRSDGSGTTGIFTHYLSEVSKEWKDKVGEGKSISWPSNGLAGKGNAGVAGLIKATPGALGYVNSNYAIENELTYAAIKNASGNFVLPSNATVMKAEAEQRIPADTRVMLTNTPERFGYPICGLTWVLIYKEQKYDSRTLDQAKETVKLVNWMLTTGQQYAPELHYVPLPPAIAKKAQAVLKTVTFGGKANFSAL